MPRFAQFDHTLDPPQPVIGWYDTENFEYPELPDDFDLLSLTDDEWTAHLEDPSDWAVQDGLLITIPPPPPSPPSLSDQAVILGYGPVTVQCPDLPNLDADYSIDQQTTQQITGITSAINAGLGLPGGGVVFNWQDVNGIPHQWPAEQFVIFAQQVMNFIYNAGQVARGYSDQLPSPILIIESP